MMKGAKNNFNISLLPVNFELRETLRNLINILLILILSDSSFFVKKHGKNVLQNERLKWYTILNYMSNIRNYYYPSMKC